MIATVFGQIVGFLNGIIGSGSAAAQGGYNTVVGSLGNVFG